MNIRQLFFSAIATCLTVPMVSFAQGLVPCGDRGGQSCQACHFVDLANNVAAWLVGVLSVAAAIMFVVAGYRLLTAGGNQNTMKQAKDMVVNVTIGFIIVLAAWLIIDFGMRALLIGGNTSLGPWNNIQCVTQPVYTVVPGVLPGASSISQTGGTTVSQCDEVFPGGPRTDCTRLENLCRAQTGATAVVDSSNPSVHTVRCDLPASAFGGGSCNQVTDTSNACHPSNLGCFNDPNAASQICNLESAGGQNVLSRSDRCADGSQFSGGIWQVNVLANHSLMGCTSNFYSTAPSAPNACASSGNSAQGGCLDCRSNSAGTRYCARWNCTITDRTAFDNCMARTLDTAANSQAACALHQQSSRYNGWGPWLTSARACNVIP